jgi:hypothetical protein
VLWLSIGDHPAWPGIVVVLGGAIALLFRR